MVQICQNCGKPFHGRANSKFCSRDCFFEHREDKLEVACSNCGKRFMIKSQKEHVQYHATHSSSKEEVMPYVENREACK